MRNFLFVFGLFSGVLFSQNSFADKAILLEADADALQARVDLIQQAKHEIIAEYFSVWDDEQSVGALAMLLEAAQRGIQVKVIVDSLSNTIPRSIFAVLEKRGKDSQGNQTLQIKVYNPLQFNLLKATHRDHAKMLIVDGERIISGGRNVGDKYFGLNKVRNFNDLDFLGEGDVAAQARQNFMQVWNSDVVTSQEIYQYSDKNLDPQNCNSAGDRDHCEFVRADAIKQLDLAEKQMLKIFHEITTMQGDTHVQSGTNKNWLADINSTVTAEFISQDPEVLNNRRHDTLTERLAEILTNAETEANIITPYLIPTERLMGIFKQLQTRGIKVRIITNSLQSTDNLFAQAGYRAAKKELISLGIEIYEYNGPDTVHAKTAVVDGKVALIGTFNIDPRSAHLNREIGIKITDSNDNKIVNDLTRTIENFRNRSTLVGKDGVEIVKADEFKGVNKKKKLALKIINLLLPVIKNQI